MKKGEKNKKNVAAADTPLINAYVNQMYPYRRRSCFANVSIGDGLKFLVKNIAALGAGFGLTILIRVFIAIADKKESAIMRAHNGTELFVTDILNFVTVLILCQFWIKSSKSNWRAICSDRALLLKTIVRDSIPLLIGLAFLFLVKFFNVEFNGKDHIVHGPKRSRLFEDSDLISGVVVLLTFHLVDRLLEWKWPSAPFNNPDLPVSPNQNDEVILKERLGVENTEDENIFIFN